MIAYATLFLLTLGLKMSVCKPFWFKTFSISIITALLVSCTSNIKNIQIPTTLNGSDPQQFGAKYTNRTYQQAALVPVSNIENQSAVINQGDFLTQLSNIKKLFE